MYKAALKPELGFDYSILKEVEVKIANRIEDDKTVHFMPEPFVFSYDEKRTRWKNEIFTPPFIHVPKKNNEEVEKGMYVMVTGLDGLEGLFQGVHDFNMRLYCPPFVKDLEGADNTHTPNFISNPNILCQFGRTGWSTVWLSHMTKTPLIAPAYARVKGDDPEIYFNEKSIEKLGLAVVFDGVRNPKEVLKEALSDSFKSNLINVNTKLVENYQTLDGMNYTANAIVSYLTGGEEALSKYRKVKPVLNGSL